MAIEIKIGFTDGARELAVASSLTQDEAVKTITDAIDGGQKFLKLTTEKGKVVMAKTDVIAWFVVGSSAVHQVGFNVGS